MRISDWSSDVCSSDLTFGCSRRTDRGDGLADSGWSDDLTDYHHFAARCGAGGPNRSRSSDPRSPAELLGRSESHDRADRRSEEHTSELQSLMRNSYAVFCLKKKKQNL